MSKHSLSIEDQNHIAHVIAERSLATVSPLMYNEATKRYLELIIP